MLLTDDAAWALLSEGGQGETGLPSLADILSDKPAYVDGAQNIAQRPARLRRRFEIFPFHDNSPVDQPSQVWLLQMRAVPAYPLGEVVLWTKSATLRWTC